MCVVCRKMRPKEELFRVVKIDDGVVVDETGRTSGRGAYICKDGDCAAKCASKKILNKVLKCAVSDEVYGKIENAFKDVENS